MDPITVSLIAAGIGGGIKAFAGLFDDTPEKVAGLKKQEADMKLAAFEENQRRAEGRQGQVLSSTEAKFAATGFRSDSDSFKSYLTGMASEFQKQNEFSKQQALKAHDLSYQAAELGVPSTMDKALGFTTDVLGTTANVAKTYALFG